MRRVSPTSSSRSGSSAASVIVTSSPYWSLMRCAIALTSACACASVTPGASRATACQLCAVRDGSGASSSRGTHRSVPAGKSSSGGITPMTVTVVLPIWSRLPSADGLPPKARIQKPWLMTAAGAPSSVCSSFANNLPSTGLTPITSKKPRDVRARFARIGSLVPETDTTPQFASSAIAEKLWLCCWRSVKFGSAKFVWWPFALTSHNCTMRSDSGYGSGRSRTESTTVKIAVVAPSPSPSVSTTTSAKPGDRRTCRNAK